MKRTTPRQAILDGSTMSDPKCEKCGSEITTGLMAVFCPKGKNCEFWVPEVEEFKKDWKDPMGSNHE